MTTVFIQGSGSRPFLIHGPVMQQDVCEERYPTFHTIVQIGADIRGRVQKFPEWSPGTRTANGTAVTLRSLTLLCESV